MGRFQTNLIFAREIIIYLTWPATQKRSMSSTWSVSESLQTPFQNIKTKTHGIKININLSNILQENSFIVINIKPLVGDLKLPTISWYISVACQ